jgi:hypothetical protein
VRSAQQSIAGFLEFGFDAQQRGCRPSFVQARALARRRVAGRSRIGEDIVKTARVDVNFGTTWRNLSARCRTYAGPCRGFF